MSIFPEMDKAEIEVKKIMLEALRKKEKEIRPIMDGLMVEISLLEQSIEKKENKLKE